MIEIQSQGTKYYVIIRDGFLSGQGYGQTVDVDYMQRERFNNADYIVVPEELILSDWSYKNGALVRAEPMALSLDKSDIVADGEDAAVISKIPSGGQVSFGRDDWAAIDDGTAEISSFIAETISVWIRAPGYRTETINIEATA